jgi:hypothetical protein
MYPKSKQYFKYTFYKLVKFTKAIENFLLVYPRRFILENSGLVDKVESDLIALYGNDFAEKIKKLIDEFLLTFDVGKRVMIVEKIFELLKSKILDMNTSILSGSGASFNSCSSQTNNSLQKKLTPKLKEKLKDFDKKVESEKQTESKMADSEVKANESVVSEKQTKNESISEDMKVVDEIIKPNAQESETSKKKISIKIENPKEITKQIEEMLSKDVMQDLQSAFGSEHSTGVEVNEELKELTGKPYSLTPLAQAFKVQFYQKLKDIKQQKDYDWLKAKSGKLDARKLLVFEMEKDVRLFKRWKVGNPNFKMDIVATIDVSGSMSNWQRLLKDLILGLGDALRRVNMGDVALSLFAEYYAIIKRLKSRKAEYEKLGSDLGAETYFNGCLNFVIKQFKESRNPTKLFFLFSDGEFFDDKNKIIKGIKILLRRGVKIFLIYPYVLGERYLEQWIKEAMQYKNFKIIEAKKVYENKEFPQLIRKIILKEVI